jgi:hypothetical protein
MINFVVVLLDRVGSRLFPMHLANSHSNCLGNHGGRIAFIGLKGRWPLDSLFTGFVGPNTNGFVDIVDEYLAVSDFAGPR